MAIPKSLIPVPGLRRVGLDPSPAPAMHLHHGWWTGSCPSCGFTLAQGTRQDKVERRATRATCPVCHEFA